MIRSRTLARAAVTLALATLSTPAWAEPPVRASGRGSGAVESFGDPASPAPVPSAPVQAGATSPAAADAAPAPDRPKRPRRRRKPQPAPAAQPVAPPAATAPAPTVVVISPTPPALEWHPSDPDNTLILETSKGTVIIALSPVMAPQSVARVKQLSRAGLYDGLLFHRVIDGFVAQTGNPNNHDGGKSTEPNLPPEFTFRLGADTPHVVAQRPTGGAAGLLQGQPYESASEDLMARSPDHRVTAWGAYCAGVMGMGRDASPDSGNSEIFFTREPARRLDRGYSVVGRILAGLDIIRGLAVGEPPASPDKMVRVRVLADMPMAERPTVEVADTAGPAYQALIERTRAQRGADFSVCDLEVPVRIHPPARPSPGTVAPGQQP